MKPQFWYHRLVLPSLGLYIYSLLKNNSHIKPLLFFNVTSGSITLLGKWTLKKEWRKIPLIGQNTFNCTPLTISWSLKRLLDCHYLSLKAIRKFGNGWTSMLKLVIRWVKLVKKAPVRLTITVHPTAPSPICACIPHPVTHETTRDAAQFNAQLPTHLKVDLASFKLIWNFCLICI